MPRPLTRVAALAANIAVLLSFAAGAPALAQAWPSKPIRVIVPAVPGGVTDIVARLVSEPLSKALGQPIIVENHAGGSGLISVEMVTKAPPDGYTLLLVTEGNPMGPNVYKDWKHDPVKSIDNVTMLGRGMFVIAVHPSHPATTLRELIQDGQKSAKPVLFGSPGNGQRMVFEQLKSLNHFKAENVAYKGGAQAVADIAAGHIKVAVLGLAPSLPYFKAGKLRPIAVTGLVRAAALPDVPTVAEQGFPGFQFTQWQGFGVPPGTPAAIVNRLHDELVKIMQMPSVVEKLASIGMDNSTSTTPAEFTEWVQAETNRWPPLFKAAGLTPE